MQEVQSRKEKKKRKELWKYHTSDDDPGQGTWLYVEVYCTFLIWIRLDLKKLKRFQEVPRSSSGLCLVVLLCLLFSFF